MDERSEEGGAGTRAPADLTGTLLAEKYKVVRPLGRGSTGTVYLCSHVTLDKHVALKVLHPELSGNPGMVARFQREAQAAARLDHAHSVRVIDVQASGELLYLAMEYVEGRDLAQILMEDWPLSDERVITIMSQILSALAAAHALGIVHRDLKPENILLRAPKTDEEGRTSGDDVVVCDFGLAQLSPVRLAGPAIAQPRMHAVTAQGRVVGTPAYMSPEQARAESQDARSDIYSAGVLLFQLLTRTLPFVADAPLAVAAMHCVTPPPPPSGYRPVNAALEAICLKALSKTREARYQTAREMQLALDAALPKRPAAKSGKRLSVPPSFTRTSSPAVPLEHDSELLASSPTIIRRSRNHSLAPAELVVQPERAPRRRLSSQQRIGVAVALLALVSVPSLLTRAKQPRHLPPRAATAQPQVSPASLPLMAAEPIAPIAIAAPPKPAPAEAPSDIAATKIVDELDVAKREPRIVVKPEPIVQAKRTVRRAIDKPHTQVEVSAIEPQPLAADPNFNAMLASMQTVQTTAPSEEAQAAPSVPVETAQTAPAEEPIAALPAPIVLSNTTVPHAEPAVVPVTAQVLPSPAQARPIEHAIDPARAHVAIGAAITHHAAVSRASVRGALNEAGLNRCYQDALRAGAAPKTSVDAQLDLSTGMGGHITSATLQGALTKSLRACIEQVARAGRLREADTGETQASVPLTFRPE